MSNNKTRRFNNNNNGVLTAFHSMKKCSSTSANEI